MSRLIFGVLSALCLLVFTVGCGGSTAPTVLQETRTQEQIEAEDAEYDAQMDEEDIGE